MRTIMRVKTLTKLALLSIPAMACVVPIDIEVEPVPPNYPPMFRPELVQPSFQREVEYDPELNEGRLTFQVPGVTDVDAVDRLYWRFFVNYDPTFSFAIAGAGSTTGRPQTTGGVNVTYPLDPCVDLSGSNTRDLHRLEVVISDRPFLDDTAASGARNQALPTDAGQIRVVWFIRVDLDRCGESL